MLRCFSMFLISISWARGASQLLSLVSLVWLRPFAASELTQFTLSMCSVLLRTDLKAREAAKVGIGNAQGVVCSRGLNEGFSQPAFLVVLPYSFGVITLSNIG